MTFDLCGGRDIVIFPENALPILQACEHLHFCCCTVHGSGEGLRQTEKKLKKTKQNKTKQADRWTDRHLTMCQITAKDLCIFCMTTIMRSSMPICKQCIVKDGWMDG